MATDPNEPWNRFIACCARAACLWEATAPKPGNVHPGASFVDLTYADFVASADAIVKPFARAPAQPVGQTILDAVRSTRRAVPRNTNLGIVVLLAPLARVPRGTPLKQGILQVLDDLTIEDAEKTYEAIRLAAPGGMGESPEQDLSQRPTQTLREVMRLAADRDSVARQYACGFNDVFEIGLAAFTSTEPRTDDLNERIVALHLEWMAQRPDTLIARKRGIHEAAQSAEMARAVLQAGGPFTAEGRAECRRLDHWLRAEGHARNPGTTADLVATTLFVAAREERLPLPRSDGISGG